MAHFQPLLKHEEILFQFPPQTTNISIVQSSSAEPMVNYAPVVHTIPTQTESFIYDVDSAPLLILTPIQSPSGTQMTANDSRASDSGVEVSPHTSFSNEVSAYFYSFGSTNKLNFTVHYTVLQCSMIICSWASKRIFQFSIILNLSHRIWLNKSASFVSILLSCMSVLFTLHFIHIYKDWTHTGNVNSGIHPMSCMHNLFVFPPRKKQHSNRQSYTDSFVNISIMPKRNQMRSIYHSYLQRDIFRFV